MDGTRIPLERVVIAFDDGATPEEIVLRYPTLSLPDVYAVIAYYLHEREAVERYVRDRAVASDKVRAEVDQRFSSSEIRERLLQRRKA